MAQVYPCKRSGVWEFRNIAELTESRFQVCAGPDEEGLVELCVQVLPAKSNSFQWIKKRRRFIQVAAWECGHYEILPELEKLPSWNRGTCHGCLGDLVYLARTREAYRQLIQSGGECRLSAEARNLPSFIETGVELPWLAWGYSLREIYARHVEKLRHVTQELYWPDARVLDKWQEGVSEAENLLQEQTSLWWWIGNMKTATGLSITNSDSFAPIDSTCPPEMRSFFETYKACKKHPILPSQVRLSAHYVIRRFWMRQLGFPLATPGTIGVYEWSQAREYALSWLVDRFLVKNCWVDLETWKAYYPTSSSHLKGLEFKVGDKPTKQQRKRVEERFQNTLTPIRALESTLWFNHLQELREWIKWDEKDQQKK